MCIASQFSFVIGALLALFAISVPFYGATLRKQAEVDLEDVRRQASLGGAKALLFKLGYPLVWFIYLPITGFFKALYLAILFMLLPLVFCS